ALKLKPSRWSSSILILNWARNSSAAALAARDAFGCRALANLLPSTAPRDFALSSPIFVDLERSAEAFFLDLSVGFWSKNRRSSLRFKDWTSTTQRSSS